MFFWFKTTDYELIRLEVYWLSLIGFWFLYSVFALWVAHRNWHWFTRFAIVAAAAALLQLIEANDLMLMQLSNVLTILASTFAFQSFLLWHETRRDPSTVEHSSDRRIGFSVSRIGLASFMLAVATIAVVFAMLSAKLMEILVPRSTSLLYGFSIGALFAFGYVSGRAGGLRYQLISMPLAILGSWQVWSWLTLRKTTFPFYITTGKSRFASGDPEASAYAAIVISGLVGLACAAYIRLCLKNSNGKLKALAKTFATLIFLGVFISCCGVFAKLAHRYPQPDLNTTGNRLEQLLAISDQLSESKVFGSYPLADDATLRNEIVAFREDLDSVRKLIDRRETVQPPFRVNYRNLRLHEVREIARVFAHKARFEYEDGNVDQSFADSLLIMRCREPVDGSMLLVGELVALAIEGIGQQAAVESIEKASELSLKKGISHILKLESDLLSLDTTYQHDEQLTWNELSWRGRLWYLCDGEEDRLAALESVKSAAKRVTASRQQLIAMLALELHRKEEGSYPTDLQSLVPKYLSTVPYDPFGGDSKDTRLIYRQIDGGSDYQLYSIGFNRKDDQGRLHMQGYGGGQYDDSPGDLNFREDAKMLLLQREEDLAMQRGDSVNE